MSIRTPERSQSSEHSRNGHGRAPRPATGLASAAAGYALRGRSVHVMSVNDYLARRDAMWMRPVYDLLGVTVGWIGQASTAAERRRAYAAQVTYAPVSEIGFDVLRDHLVTDTADLVVIGAYAAPSRLETADSRRTVPPARSWW